MVTHHDIKLFEEKKVRTVWDDEKEEWYFSIVDVCAILADQVDYDHAKNYWKVLKHRLIKEGNELVTSCNQLKLIIVVGTRPEIIRLAAVINKCRQYFDVILAHTGQNYDYNLNGIFFKDLKLAEPEVYMDAVGDDLGATCGNIINCSYKLFAQTKPDGVLVLGDTNSCLSVIGAKRLHIPIFHMEAGNRCKDECLPEETNRRIVDIISDSVWRKVSISSFLLIVKKTLIQRRTSCLFSLQSTRWRKSTICLFFTVVTHAAAIVLQHLDFSSTHV